ncbi:endonuclease domain-containing protein [Archangium lansingense]|uniref:Endonuclease domain-containing protein n=1 Tax=Archangium lansingense TaxID=2995310 RepID=A0ABT4A805_9BACT|nr:endonuclease domain-containing protein [Archangium lansinium]MCY1077726.1 endonuclease domain-containing protein [Archangium lansinium]
MPDYRGNTTIVGLLERCRDLRRSSTDAESLLWKLLRARQLAGFKFRRQHQFGPYILDFFCAERSLRIELDGDQHALPANVVRDAGRSRFLAEQGVRVLRFGNRDVLLETEAVLMRLYTVLTESEGRPSP